MYDPGVDYATFKFKVMQRFKDAVECKSAVRKWVIIHGYKLRWIKSSSKQLDAICQKGCNWRLYGSMLRHENTFVIKTLIYVWLRPHCMQNTVVIGTEVVVVTTPNVVKHSCCRNMLWL